MPVGGVLAKESISISKGQSRVGPLFIMEKVGAETETGAETEGWAYSAVQANGRMMTVPSAFCHDCHVDFEAQDSLTHPVPELRVANRPARSARAGACSLYVLYLST